VHQWKEGFFPLSIPILELLCYSNHVGTKSKEFGDPVLKDDGTSTISCAIYDSKLQ